jgi:hypothetical protein
MSSLRRFWEEDLGPSWNTCLREVQRNWEDPEEMMGLKYKIFMLKGTADDLYERIRSTFPRSIDETDFMQQEREWYLQPITQGFPIEQRSFELESYMKDGGQTGFHIWFMDHPTRKGIVMGGYTDYWMSKDFTAIFCLILLRCGYPEFLLQSYHHGVNDGDIVKVHLEGDVDFEVYESLEDEEQKWGKFSKRINGICGYPVLATHYYLSKPEIHLVPWKYSIRVKDRSW